MTLFTNADAEKRNNTHHRHGDKMYFPDFGPECVDDCDEGCTRAVNAVEIGSFESSVVAELRNVSAFRNGNNGTDSPADDDCNLPIAHTPCTRTACQQPSVQAGVTKAIKLAERTTTLEVVAFLLHNL